MHPVLTAIARLLLGTSLFSSLFLSRPWFDASEGVTLAEYAAAAYCPPETISNWTCPRCAGLTANFEPHAVVYDEAWNLQGYVGYSSDFQKLMVVFRGTIGSSLENWIHNLMATRTQANLPGMPDDAKVHDGFYRSWTRSLLQKQVIEAVQDILKERGVVPVLVVGHSLGGALATLCAAELMYTYNLTDVQLYTFGSPRVGNAAFAEALRNSTLDHTRMTHDRDVVPTVPFEHLGFHHTAREVWQRTVRVGRSPMTLSVEVICDEYGEDPNCQNSICGYPGSCASVADHLEYLGVSLGSTSTSPC